MIWDLSHPTSDILLSGHATHEKDGDFKFLLQSFIKEHSSVNGLVTMDTVKSLYDMILDHARSFVSASAEVSKAAADKAKTSGCFHCGSKDHWQADCPKREDQGYGKGQPAQAGVNVPQPAAKGKVKGQAKGQWKGQSGDKQAAGVSKGKGKSGKKGSGKKGGKGGKKGKHTPKYESLQLMKRIP